MSGQSAWISVGALGEAFEPGNNTLEPSDALRGRQIELFIEDGSRLRLQFEGGGRVNLKEQVGGREGSEHAADCYVAEVRKGVFFLDYIDPDPARGPSKVSVVLDLGAGVCTVLRGRLPDPAFVRLSLADRIERGGDLTGIAVQCLAGTDGSVGTSSTPRHEPTQDLVGRRVRYTYSPTETYEHVYLNPQRYTWHCLQGAEAGLADTDSCLYRRVADGLYLFSWSEKIVPTLGIVVVDLTNRRTCGKIFGYRNFACEGLANFPVGARISAIG